MTAWTLLVESQDQNELSAGVSTLLYKFLGQILVFDWCFTLSVRSRGHFEPIRSQKTATLRDEKLRDFTRFGLIG